MVVLAILGVRYGPTIVELGKEPENLVRTIESFGHWGVLVLIGVQFFQIVLPPIPGRVVQIAGGYLFGLWPGLLYLTMGSILGSIVAFYASRTFGAPLVMAMVPEDKLRRLESIMQRRKVDLAVFIAFLIPAFPKDLLTYVAGLTSISGSRFLLVGLSGRLPGLIMATLVGSSLREGSYSSVILVGSAMIVILVVSVWKRRWISEQLSKG